MGAVVRVAERRGQGHSPGMGGGHEGQQSGADGLGAGVCVQGQGWQGTALCLLCWAQCCIAASPFCPAWEHGGWGSAGVEQGSTKPCHVLALPLPHLSYLDKGQSQACRGSSQVLGAKQQHLRGGQGGHGAGNVPSGPGGHSQWEVRSNSSTVKSMANDVRVQVCSMGAPRAQRVMQALGGSVVAPLLD